MQCIEFLAATTKKIMQRIPLKYSVIRAISCFVPSRVVSSRTLSEKRMAELAQLLYERNHFTSVVSDCAKVQFSTLCAKAAGDLRNSFESYSRQDTRLDAFYFSITGDKSDFAELWSVVKCVLVLSHGNANVESGFSVNGEMLMENLHEQSLVAQRQVYDAVLAAGGVTAVEVDKSLLQFVRSSHSRYLECLRKKRLSTHDEEQKASERK